MELFPGMVLRQKIGVCMMFAGGLSLHIQLHRLIKKYNALAEEYNEKLEQNKSLYDRLMYILTTLEQKGFDLYELFDEFDLIALRNMAPPE